MQNSDIPYTTYTYTIKDTVTVSVTVIDTYTVALY